MAFINTLRNLVKKACASEFFNFLFGVIWFGDFVGGSCYHFFFNDAESGSTSAVFGVLNILVSVFIFFVSLAGKPVTGSGDAK